MVRLRSPQMLNQKGIASILVLVILLIGLGLGVYLVKQKTNLFPKAYDAPIQVASECTYAPEAIYNVRAKISTAQSINVASPNCPELNSNTNFVGTLLYTPAILQRTGIGDSIKYLSANLGELCKLQGFSGPICSLCRQKVDCDRHYVRVEQNVENLTCSKDVDGTAKYEFSGSGLLYIGAYVPQSMSESMSGCKLQIQEENLKFDIDASYLRDRDLSVGAG